MARSKTTVAQPRRVGALTPEEFEHIASEVLGGRRWQRTLAAATGWNQSTITRYLQGVLPVPKDVAVLLEALKTIRGAGLPLPEAFTAAVEQSNAKEAA